MKQYLTFERIIEFIVEQVYLKTSEHLSSLEIAILWGACNQESYEETAQKTYLTEGYIRDLASKLWKKLSAIFLEKINKKNFVYVLEKVIEQSVAQSSVTKKTSAIAKRKVESEKSVKILLVESQEKISKLLFALLNSQGHNVCSVMDGEKILEILEETLANIVFINIFLPGMDGYQVCQKIKDNYLNKDVIIIFMTDISALIDPQKAFSVGGNDYIVNLSNEDDILARLSHQLELRNQRMAIVADIAEKQEKIQSLLHSHFLFSSILNQLYFGIATLEADRDLVTTEIKGFHAIFINSSFADIFKLEHRQYIDLSMENLFRSINIVNLSGKFIEVILTEKVFKANLTIYSQSYQMVVTKLGNGLTLSLHPLDDESCELLNVQDLS